MCNPNDSRPDATAERTVLVTGATGYIGGRLVPRLLEAGHRVRCLVRTPRKLESRAWINDPHVEVVGGDLSDPAPEPLARALRGCEVAYYLVHAMESAASDYAEQDRQMARRFAAVAAEAGIERIVYLGGLGEGERSLSEHLDSRHEVGRMLASGSVPVTELRAAMIIGSGSASFEILRYLVERLPIMVTPKWVRTECQPIAVSNVLGYLVDCLDVPETADRTLDIGGTDVMSYDRIMRVMAQVRGLRRRLVIPVPVLTPRLSSLWIHLITPLSKEIARPLAEGLRNRVVCRDDEAQRLMPKILSVAEAITAAVHRLEINEVETAWTMAGALPGDPDWAGGKSFVDEREVEIDAPPGAVYRAVCRVGGGHGWYGADWLWKIRGAIDRLLGGPGLRRGRRDPEDVGYGEALDFWRVTGLEQDRRLELRAEMKVPGEAELAFDIRPASNGGDPSTRLVQTARFQPRGLAGLLYWYTVLPFHNLIFRGMLRGIKRAAESSRDSRNSRNEGSE